MGVRRVDLRASEEGQGAALMQRAIRLESMVRVSSPVLRALLSMFALADMVKPHGLLVLVSSAYRYASTPSLSTS